jgi:hypothetical protein
MTQETKKNRVSLQLPLFSLCARCQAEVPVHQDVCSECWIQWLLICRHTANKFSWDSFLANKPVPFPRQSCWRCSSYQEVCKDCLYGGRG